MRTRKEILSSFYGQTDEDGTCCWAIRIIFCIFAGRNRERTIGPGGAFEGFTAQIIQHEIDHCDGILV